MLAFALGVLVHAIAIRFVHMHTSTAGIDEVTVPSNEFKGTGFTNMVTEHYIRESDGASVRFGCSDRSSASEALKLVRVETTGNLVETTYVFDVQSRKIGERVVWNFDARGARIEWNEGARLFYISGDSLEDARTFEVSRIWSGAGCWDFRSFR
jgi:hypothetical protein